jgi:hypothetical protein
MNFAKGEGTMAKTTTERVAVWLTPEQVAWLKTKENVSVTLRALVNEAMNMQRLADSLKQKAARKAHPPAKALAKSVEVKQMPKPPAARPKESKVDALPAKRGGTPRGATSRASAPGRRK